VEKRYTKKFITVYLAIGIIIGLMAIENQIFVKAEEPAIVRSVDNDIELEEPNKENDETADEQTTKWESIKSIFGSIFIEMLGACLGFLSAIALTNRSNKKLMKELDASLLKELGKIQEELKERIENGFEEYYRYQTPMWDINLESGNLALVSNSQVYNKYIEIYSKIQYAQGLESEYVHTKLFKTTSKKDDFADKYIEIIDNARKREANTIYEYIENNILGEYTNAGRKNTAHTGQ